MADCVSRRGKRKTTQFRGKFVLIIIFYFKNIFLIINAFYNKQLQTLFKDQLVCSKATCSFKDSQGQVVKSTSMRVDNVFFLSCVHFGLEMPTSVFLTLQR